MTSLEEQYNIDVKYILAKYPAGSREREEAKRALWEKFQADKFSQSQDGNLGIIYDIQNKFAAEIYNVIEAFYSGTISAKDYPERITDTTFQYFTKLVELGFASGVPEREWMAPYTTKFVEGQLKLLPAKTSKFGFTPEEAVLLCDPCRDNCKEAFLAFHTEFGVGRLKDNPDIYGGVVNSLKKEEQTGVVTEPEEVLEGLPGLRVP